jgi:lactoylglutathione lyase
VSRQRDHTIPVDGLFETHLLVFNLERSVAFYRDIVGLEVAYELPARDAVLLWIGRPGGAMLGLWTAGNAPLGMRLHLAFRAALDDVLGAPDALRAQGITPRSFYGRETDEPDAIGWMPAAAVYFEDPDGNLLEYLAMLDQPARPDLGIVSWSQWAAGTADRPHRSR